ncbi:MarR family winged helix-turn-helix transcriptional regulator [Longispora albida]|uniref:MarR family winged helix-turn-helix transcriptional regulator n=1 Tax=Longispora albida TaxID=203523 RepID=UPI000371A2CE|nr:MarR family transcriptional regulator [Longispora albida]
MDPRWLTSREMGTWLAYLAAARKLEEALDRQLQRDSGMSHAYYTILATLSATPGWALRMSELAKATNSSQSRLSHAVARLEEAGWVSRSGCPSDKRGSIASLTDAGHQVLAEAAPGHVEAVRSHLFDALTAEQAEQLGEICEAILAHSSGQVPVAAGSR